MLLYLMEPPIPTMHVFDLVENKPSFFTIVLIIKFNWESESNNALYSYLIPYWFLMIIIAMNKIIVLDGKKYDKIVFCLLSLDHCFFVYYYRKYS